MPTGVAVVELFTSQGCNSCPPADEVLQQIQAVAARRKLPVYVLSFHVDYWNKLGWTDPYSQPDFTQRQKAYAASSGNGRIYTPQMIVSGRREFVGSDRKAALAAIEHTLSTPGNAPIELAVRPQAAGARLQVGYKAPGRRPGEVINLALVHSPDANHVRVGENAGRQLTHVNVVRDFHTQQLTAASGVVQLDLPRDVNPEDFHVIAYTQDSKTLVVTGASRAPLR